MLKTLLLERMPAERLDEQIREKQEAFCGLLTDEGALRILAHEAGIAEAKPPFVSSLLSSATLDVPLSATVRIQHVFAEKHFESSGRKGRLQKARIVDASGEGELVLWNSDADLFNTIRRSDVLCLRDVVPKSIHPLELHGRLSSEIWKSNASTDIAVSKTPLVKLNALPKGESDFFCRVMEKQPIKTFERNGRKGFLTKLNVLDDTAQAVLACWDQNAHAAQALDIGDVILLEGVSLRNGEIQVGWSARMLRNPDGPIDLSRSTAVVHPERTLSELDEATALVHVQIDKIIDAKRSYTCHACGSKNGVDACACGALNLVAKPVVWLEVSDASKAMRAVLFDDAALKLLGVNGETDLSLLIPLKRDYLAGKKISLLAHVKQNSYSDEKELVGIAVLD
jgi:hypothetical protein